MISADSYSFRWVECQFKALQSCPCSEYHLDHLLNSLPQSLDETYERMLCNIEAAEDARRILTLLCFAQRPLTVQELIDGVAVEINDPMGLNRKRRLQDVNGIRDICGGLIDIGLGADHTTETYREEDLIQSARIAHFSVQEYLESERIRHQKAAMFSLTGVAAHTEIAQICLTYLLEHGLSSSALDYSLLKEFPLAHFAAEYWYPHYQNTANHDPGLEDSILKLFQRRDSFATWVKLHDVDKPWGTVNFHRALDDIPAPVYYASLLGLDQVLHDLFNSEKLESILILALSPAPTSNVSKKINAQGGRFGNALQAASVGGYEKVVRMLLDKGADINAQGGYFNNALQEASFRGHDNIVKILLDNGADINAQGGEYGNALQAASFRGHVNLVRLLLNHDTVVNRKDIQGRTPLHLASAGGRLKTVKMLLDFGLDPTVVDAQGRNCLHHAASQGSVEMINWLLKEGFDPNYADRDGWTSLHWAAKNGSISTMEVLKAAGARSTVEFIQGWTPDSVFLFHQDPASKSPEYANSELVAKRNISSLAVAVELIDDGRKVSSGLLWDGVSCDGCLLVSFDLNVLSFFV